MTEGCADTPVMVITLSAVKRMKSQNSLSLIEQQTGICNVPTPYKYSVTILSVLC
jgi:hypothetical protein